VYLLGHPVAIAFVCFLFVCFYSGETLNKRKDPSNSSLQTSSHQPRHYIILPKAIYAYSQVQIVRCYPPRKSFDASKGEISPLRKRHPDPFDHFFEYIVFLKSLPQSFAYSNSLREGSRKRFTSSDKAIIVSFNILFLKDHDIV